MKIYLILAIAFSIISLVTAAAYAIDKHKAKRGLYRIPERVLLGLSLLGGAVGGLLAMQLFRHKTRHAYFYLINVIGIAWQIALIAFLAANGI